MKEILIIITTAVFSYTLGYGDGYWKKNHTAQHAVKWFVWIGFFAASYMKMDVLTLFGMCLMTKPFHDFGYTNRTSNKILAIGTTSWDDIAIRKIYGIKGVENSDVRFVFITYLAAIFIGIEIIHEAERISNYFTNLNMW